MEESALSTISDGEIIGIKFCLATHHEISKSSISGCPISHASQLANPFLGLPLEVGKCESCGTAEPGKCEGHFGYVELPIPVYHPDHIVELRKMLSLLCLKCLKLKTHKVPLKTSGVLESLLSPCCEETSHISIKENRTTDGASFLELKLPARSRIRDGTWHFLERYGYRYGDGLSRTLLPSEVSVILKKLPEETKRKLAKKGYFPQDGYILRYLPVPPNCLSVPDISDGVIVMSSDLSTTMLKKVLKQIEIIKSSRSGEPNFESHEVEANELQVEIAQYLQFRGAGKASRDVANRYGANKDVNDSSTKAWLEKMRTLFISKGSGFSSRSVITGDAYKRVNEIGLPSEIAQKITFEERVNLHNINYLQRLVDNNLCLTYKDGLSTYSLREGSKGHTFLRPGQVVHRRIMDGDIVFINRPPTTHKHSLQALYVYIHGDHTVKINPLMCGPLAADFDGDCVHLFYPQSLAARAEVVELFSVEKQLLSSHTGNLNLQLATDSLLSLKTMLKVYFLEKASAQQLAMFASTPLPPPALPKSRFSGPCWTALQVLQSALPSDFDCCGDQLLIRGSDILKLDFHRDVMQSVISEIVASIFFEKGPREALDFFDSLQPLLMENLVVEGFSVGLRDFFIPSSLVENIQKKIQDISPLLFQLRSTYNELVELQLENYIRILKVPVTDFILKSSALGNLIDSKSDGAISKVVQQIAFLGLQLSDKGKFYSRNLVVDMSSLFQRKYPFGSEYPAGEFGLLKSSFFHGLDLYEEMVHSIATREVIIRSSRGLAEPGTLFKNLMAILRDVVICYDGSVRNISSNSIILFDYGFKGEKSSCLFPAGEPVGVLAATAMSNPAYKAVLDSSPSSNSSWEMMKEILFCRVNFRNDTIDRRVILYLNDCHCGGKYCRENASYLVKNLLKKVSLRDAAVEFLIEYRSPQVVSGSSEIGTGLIGHIHLNKALLNDSNISMHDVLQRCQDEINIFRKKKKNSYHFKRIILSVSECCFFEHGSKSYDIPCLKFFWQDMTDSHLEKTSHIMADMICPVLLDTIIKGDPRISTVNIIWISPDTTTWIQGPCKSHKGELAVEVVLEKKAVKQSGDAWRIVLDCCLPVFHLIDTVRSIPYAIKQIQDLLGISCTFDQAVQRLSTSVTMVAKGVLKEHLILLASSMTSTGNLIGFNMGGIKALCRALGVQVPFTEATLYTPRKCFERAAEKCHMDSLSSIVASCSWGKRVAVGTGAKFDILWERKETGMNLGGFDIYNFLQLVRGSNEEEMDTGCLGEEIENFELEDGYMEQDLSPEHDSNAVFEENAEIESGLGNQTPNGGMYGESGWDKVPSSSDGKGWNTNKSKDWSSWEQPKAKSQVEDSSRSGGWNAPEYWKGPSQSQTLSTWGEQVKEADETGFNKNTTQHSLRKSEGPSSCKSEVGRDTTELSKSDCWKEFLKGPGQMESAATWENQADVKRSQSNGKDVQSQLDWDSVDKQLTQARQSTNLATNSWNASPKDQPKDASSCPVWNSKSAGWESELGQHNSISKKTKHETSASWGSSSELHSPVSFHWGSANDGAGNASVKNPSWGQTIGSALKNTDLESTNDWDSSGKIHQLTCSDGWDSGKDGADNEGKTESIWGQTSGSSSKKYYTQSTGNWGSSDELCQPASSHGLHPEKASACNESETGSSWGQPGASTWKKNNNETAHGWGSSNELHQGMNSQGLDSAKVGDGCETETKSPWGNPGGSAWKSKRPEIGGVWGSSNELHQGVSSQDLDSVKAGEGSETETKSPWGQPGVGSAWKSKRPETFGSGGSWGSSNSGEWKNKKNRPPNSPRTPRDSSISVPLTATRQRLDVFTSDEQDILSEVEEIMLQIRKIMHQAGYIDGDRLSADYQSYILSNVFNHHPDKEIKMGAGIDYIMVSRHSSFQDSRCFYVVSTDGQKEDFSYRKCLENLIRVKYPDLAEAFIAKYFKRPRREQNSEEHGNREQSSEDTQVEQ